ncbi:MAG: hypothetical protein MK116_10570 [Phycisphaerales bacterium]|nr:hypothetical protein [Phycisphaerales bacterium]
MTTSSVTTASVVIYRLDGERDRPKPLAGSPENFHGWRILRSVSISDPDRVDDVMERLREQIAQGTGRSRCFIPRHGIRHMTEDGSVIDYVICYQCSAYSSYRDGESAGGGAIGGSRRWLDRLLARTSR